MQSPHCFLQNITLGIEKELICISCEYLIEVDREYSETHHTRRNRAHQLEENMRRVQVEFQHFHNSDPFICPLFVSGKCNVSRWDGNECIAFSHIALILFGSIEPIDKLLLDIWKNFLSFVSAFHHYKNNIENLKKAIQDFRETKKLLLQLGEKWCKNLPNWHAPEHYLEATILYGMVIEFSSQIGESALWGFKQWLKTINFHNISRDVFKHEAARIGLILQHEQLILKLFHQQMWKPQGDGKTIGMSSLFYPPLQLTRLYKFHFHKNIPFQDPLV